jgi:hypothetical protein
MDAPRWFKKELSLINPRYKVFYDERKRQYQIRKSDSTIICIVPYPSLDNRILMDLRRGLYWATKAKELVQKIDEHNARLIEQSNIEDEYISRYMAKRIWHYYREKTLDLGGKNLPPKKVGFGEM